MTDFDPFASTLGGMLIGAAGALLLVLNGRLAGISNIVGGLLRRSSPSERSWRASFLAGLLVGGLGLALLWPSAIEASPASLPVIVVAGLLVGLGSQVGSGCTSGHGICGISRLSVRSIVATLTFMGTGFATVFVVRHLLG